MYIWNVNALIEDIKAEKLSQKEQFKYALSYTVLMMLASDPLIHAGEVYSYIDSISSLLMLIVSIVGLYFCYLANRNADDKDFVLRFFTIGLPLTVRFIAVVIPIALVVGAIEGFLSFDASQELAAESSTTSFSQVAISVVLMAIFYFYYQAKFRLFSPSKVD